MHRFSRPRVDLVTWVLVSRVVPIALEQMDAIISKTYRRATAAWRKSFKREWKELQNYHVDPHSLVKHYTDPCK